MIDKQHIKDMFPIRNCYPNRIVFKEYDDLYNVKIEVIEVRNNVSDIISINVPYMDKNGIFTINGIKRQLCYCMKPNPMFNRKCMDVNFTYLWTPQMLMIDFLRKAIAKHLGNVYEIGKAINPQVAQLKFDSLLKTSELSHAIKGLAKDYPAKIFLDFNQSSTDEKMPFNTKGILDWTSVSQSSNTCGRSMYMSKDCKINSDGLFIKRGSPYCNILTDNLVLPEFNRKRTPASNFKASSELVYKEDPLTYPEEDTTKIQGVHLTTIHAIIPDVYKEQIVISKTAARKLSCIIKENQAFVVPKWANNTFKMNIKQGDKINPGEIIGKYKDCNGANVDLISHVKKTCDVTNIKYIKSRVAENECTKIIVEANRVHELKSGDKITNRHGNKGIVKVVEDKLMPTINGKPAEVVTNALATLRRRNPGQIVEAMLNNIAEKFGPAPTPHFFSDEYKEDGKSLPEALLKECELQEHEFNGQKVMAWSGKLFWIVLDKFGHTTNTYVTKRNDYYDGIYPNHGKISGTRIYLTVMQIMLSKGWKDLLYKLIEENATGIDKIQKYLYCLSC